MTSFERSDSDILTSKMTLFLEKAGYERKDINKQNFKSKRVFFNKTDDSPSSKRRMSKIIPFYNPGATSALDSNCSLSLTSSIASSPPRQPSRRLRTIFKRLRRKPANCDAPFKNIQIIGGPGSVPRCAFPDYDDEQHYDDDTLVTSNGLHKPRRNRIKKPFQTVDLNFIGVIGEEPAPSHSPRRVLYFCLMMTSVIFIGAFNACPIFSVRATMLSIFKSSRGVSNTKRAVSKSTADKLFNVSNIGDTSIDKSTMYNQLTPGRFVSFGEHSHDEYFLNGLGLAGGDHTNKKFHWEIDDKSEGVEQGSCTDTFDFQTTFDEDLSDLS